MWSGRVTAGRSAARAGRGGRGSSSAARADAAAAPAAAGEPRPPTKSARSRGLVPRARRLALADAGGVAPGPPGGGSAGPPADPASLAFDENAPIRSAVRGGFVPDVLHDLPDSTEPDEAAPASLGPAETAEPEVPGLTTTPRRHRLGRPSPMSRLAAAGGPRDRRPARPRTPAGAYLPPSAVLPPLDAARPGGAAHREPGPRAVVGPDLGRPRRRARRRPSSTTAGVAPGDRPRGGPCGARAAPAVDQRPCQNEGALAGYLNRWGLAGAGMWLVLPRPGRARARCRVGETGFASPLRLPRRRDREPSSSACSGRISSAASAGPSASGSCSSGPSSSRSAGCSIGATVTQPSEPDVSAVDNRGRRADPCYTAPDAGPERQAGRGPPSIDRSAVTATEAGSQTHGRDPR